MIADVATMYRTHRAEVWRFLYARTGDRWVADDLTQDVFVRALTAAYADRGKPGAWLVTIARNLWLSQLRSGAARPYPVMDIESWTAAAPTPAAENLALRIMWLAEASLALHAAIDDLTPTQRRVVALRYWVGCDIPETATVTGMSTTAVKASAARAKQSLRRDQRVAALVGGGSRG